MEIVIVVRETVIVTETSQNKHGLHKRWYYYKL